MYYHLIHHCLQLAERGRGKVSPNPLVGCVIVDENNQIVAEGWHEKHGDVHAERTAIENLLSILRDAQHTCHAEESRSDVSKHKGDWAPQDDKSLTLIVNLEPCCTYGKQPPCTDAIIQSGIKRVVFGARDGSNAGSSALRQHGIEVIGPLFEAECRYFNRGFFSRIEKNRPWVTLKKAMRSDGSIDGKITNEEQDQWSHTQLRATHDAILVGAGTVIADNPRLNIRSQLPAPQPSSDYALLRFGFVRCTLASSDLRQAGSSQLPAPQRIILDPHTEIPPHAQVLIDEDSDRTMVIREKLPIPDLLKKLLDEGINSVLVEGGPKVWKAFEESGIIDEVIVLTTDTVT